MTRKTNIVDILDTYTQMREDRNKKNQRAVVVGVSPTTALIRVGGSQQVQHAQVQSNSDIEVGDTVYVQQSNSNTRVRWMIVSVISRRSSSGVPAVERSYRELFPPSNVESADLVPGVITVRWDAPVVYPVVFQVQTSTDMGATNSEIVLQTRGSYAIIETEETSLDIRIRSVAYDGQTSGWSPWITATPSTGSNISFNPYTSGYWSSYGYPFVFSDASYVEKT